MWAPFPLDPTAKKRQLGYIWLPKIWLWGLAIYIWATFLHHWDHFGLQNKKKRENGQILRYFSSVFGAVISGKIW